MADVVELKRKKKAVRRRVSVCWGGMNHREVTDHIINKADGCGISEDTLIVEDEHSVLTGYPIGSVFYWSERDEDAVQ